MRGLMKITIIHANQREELERLEATIDGNIDENEMDACFAARDMLAQYIAAEKALYDGDTLTVRIEGGVRP
jgi:hypothetical protein